MLVVARTEDPSPAGVLAYEPAADGWLEFLFVAMRADLRGWGYGSEAVRLVEDAGVARRFAAGVTGGNGLGVYFWSRLGYRPEPPGEVAWRRARAGDMITMIREPGD
jgi:hypothetical protein